jgi:hypothetical protein
MALAREGPGMLTIALPCVGSGAEGDGPGTDGAAGECTVPAYREWLGGWDDVRVECRVGAHQPDLVLTRAGSPVGAIEVLVTHEVTPEKAAALADLGVPWVEVAATALAMGTPEAWTPVRPLPVRRASRDVDSWQCPAHQAERMLFDARQAYRAARDAGAPDEAMLLARGRAIRDMEARSAALTAEANRVRTDTAGYELDLARRLAEAPAHLEAARARLERARQDYEAVARAADERHAQLGPDEARVAALEDELRGLDEEAARYEGLRRALSRLRTAGGPPGSQSGNPGVRPLYWCPVDVYRVRNRLGQPGATRAVYHVELAVVPGKSSELRLVEDGGHVVHRIEAEEDAADVLFLAALERSLDLWRQQGAVVDRPSAWIRVPPGEAIPGAAWDAVDGPVPRAYHWDDEQRRWVLPAAEPKATGQ